MIYERSSNENTGINVMDHNSQIQGCTSEHPRDYRVGAFRILSVTLALRPINWYNCRPIHCTFMC